MRGGLPVDSDLHLGDLLRHGADDIHSILQLGDFPQQIIRDCRENAIVVTGDLHADIIAAQHGGHVRGAGGDLAAGNVLQEGAKALSNLTAAAASVAAVHQHQGDRGGFRLGQVVEALQLRHLFLSDRYHPVGVGCGLIHIRANGSCDADADLPLVHFWQQYHVGA